MESMLDANRRYAAGFDAAGRPAPPALQLVILTCMDARFNVEDALGLDIGDAHILRNAGGRASDDAIRSLIVSSRLLGTREIAVIHHTNCGMAGLTNEQLRERVTSESGADASHIDFLPFRDSRGSVAEDVERIRTSPHIDPDIAVTGWMYDVDTGQLDRVV